MEENIRILLNKIPEFLQKDRFILGIDGLSRSGKTTFLKKIEMHLLEMDIPVRIFHIDDYIVERKSRYDTEFDEWYEYYQLQWDTEWLKQNMFKKLKVAKELDLQIYDNRLDTQKWQSVKIPDPCLIIIEGVFLQRSEWRPFFDSIIYLECPREIRLRRESEITQKDIKKFHNRYWKAEDYYEKTISPKEKADLVIFN